MEWSEQFLPWRLDRLSDDKYTALMDELNEMDLTDDENLRKSVTARYFLHWAVLSLPEAHPDCIQIAKEAIGRLYKDAPQFPRHAERLTHDELIQVDSVLGDIYC